MLVTGGPPVRGGGGMPQRIIASSRAAVGVADHRGRIVRKHARHRREVADVAVDDAEQREDGGLVGGDRVEIADVDGPPLVRMVADF